MEKEMKEQLKELWGKASDMILSSGLLKQPTMLTYEEYIENGIAKAKCKCRACGHAWEIKGEEIHRRKSYEPIEMTCPVCKNKRATQGKSGIYTINEQNILSPYSYRIYLHGTKLFVSIKRNDNYNIIVYEAEWEYPYEKETPFSWLDKEAEITVEIKQVLFISSTEVYAYEGDEGFKTLKNTSVRKSLFSLECCKGIYDLHTLEPDKSVVPTIELLINHIEQSKRQNEEKDPWIGYQPQVLDNMLNEIKPLKKRLINMLGRTKVYSYSCERCGHSWEAKYDPYYETKKCPKCGNSHCVEEGVSNYGQPGLRYESTDLPDNDLLIRFGYITWEHEDGHFIFDERIRFFVSKSEKKIRTNIYAKKETGFVKIAITNIIDMYYPMLFQSEAEAADAIKCSSMATSGLAEAVGLGEKEYTPAYNPTLPIPYLKEYKKYPQVELVAKANIPTILFDICKRQISLCQGSTVGEVLNLSKPDIKIARELGLNYADATDLSTIRNADPSITANEYAGMRHDHINVYQLIDLSNVYGISIRKALSYLDTVYNHQCIEKANALTIWQDYLQMAKKCRFDLSDKSRKYPSSLKKEHDIAMFAFNKLKEDLNERMFKEQAEKNKFLEYSYEDLFVKVPYTPQEVIEEATMQKNCLRSYIGRIIEGKTIVTFIRKKDDPTRAFVTAEIGMDRRILQVKGYCNSNPKTKKLDEFLNHWKAAKGLRMAARY